ncbi:uncharacterized protein METZ01_LOCUS495738, partial [marine metagenome]
MLRFPTEHLTSFRGIADQPAGFGSA